MRFLSLDVETTGLNPKTDQMLQLGIVAVDTEIGILGSLEINVVLERISGHPFAIAMNAGIIAQMSKMLQVWNKESQFLDDVITKDHRVFVYEEFMERAWGDKVVPWLNYIGFSEEKRFNLAGKNLATFDIPFIEAAGIKIPYRHRIIDPAILYFRSGDATLPDLKQCLDRSDMPKKEVEHTAVADATDVANLVLEAFRKMEAVNGK